MSVTRNLSVTLGIGLAIVVQVNAQSFLTNGLVAYYPFTGNANDASGNGNNGIVYGATLTTNRFGSPNGAYSFDGVSSRIQLPETVFGPTTPGATISAWLTTDGGPYTSTQAIWDKGVSNGEMQFNINSSQFKFGPFLETGPTAYYAVAPVLSNSLVQLVGVYAQGQKVSLYVNGVLANSISVPQDNLWVDPSGYPLVSAIGIYDFVPGPYDGFRGIIEDFRIYNRALSSNEVQQLYAYEAGSCAPHSAAATATVVNGFVVDATITDGGCGYTNTPLVLIAGGGGTGATATAVVSNGVVVKIQITDAGVGYTNIPSIYLYTQLRSQVGLVRAVKPLFSNLLVGVNYQLQLSTDLMNWTNQGSIFTPTNAVMSYPQYFDVTDWNQLYFRLGASP